MVQHCIGPQRVQSVRHRLQLNLLPSAYNYIFFSEKISHTYCQHDRAKTPCQNRDQITKPIRDESAFAPCAFLRGDRCHIRIRSNITWGVTAVFLGQLPARRLREAHLCLFFCRMTAVAEVGCGQHYNSFRIEKMEYLSLYSHRSRIILIWRRK